MKQSHRSTLLAATFAAIFFQLVDSTSAENAGTPFSVPPGGIKLLTGDSWIQNNRIIRLYGVQACLRGRPYTDHEGKTQDCGIVSIAMLSAILRDTSPVCHPIANIAMTSAGQPVTVLAVCTCRIREQSLDLGSMMITQGYAFAALANDGKAVYKPYLVQELIAQRARAGLWAFGDIPNPSRELLARHP